MEKVPFCPFVPPKHVLRGFTIVNKLQLFILFIFSSLSTFAEFESKTVDEETSSSQTCGSVLTHFLFSPVSVNESKDLKSATFSSFGDVF